MSSKTFDPNKITLKDIFRAKQERRRRLATLTLEEKIEILKRLQTVPAKLENEKLVFESFLRVCPDFAGERVREWDVVEEWYANRALAPPPEPFDKRPDVIAVTASGKRIGIELKSWVNREQITAARKQERIRENILKAIGEQPRNPTRNIGYVLLSPKQVRFNARDEEQFRQELFALIEHLDNTWSQMPTWLQERGDIVSDFSRFPILDKYLNCVDVHAATQTLRNTGWIQLPTAGGAYSPNDMLGTLRSSLLAHRSDERYKDLRTHVGFDEVYLLVHYDFKAFAYNTPFDAPNFGFKEAAKFAENVLGGDGGNFDGIFLFHFLWGKEEAYRIL